MLVDKYNRKIDYLRISVTDRCNLRCIYCMPQHGVEQKEHSEILTFEEISCIVNQAASLGINKLRITGGEPLVRKDILSLISSLSQVKGINDIALTTNGILLERFAAELKNAGLGRINISLDTLDKEKFRFITRGETKLSDVLRGVSAAVESGFQVKLNVVVMRHINADEILDFVRFGEENGVIVRFIEFMPVGDKMFWNQERFVSADEIIKKISLVENLEPVSTVKGNGPARYFRIQGSGSILGFISALSCKFCQNCNRLRLTADGLLLPCLAGDSGLSLKSAVRMKNDPNEISRLIREAVLLKPKKHSMEFYNSPACCIMSQVGG